MSSPRTHEAAQCDRPEAELSFDWAVLEAAYEQMPTNMRTPLHVDDHRTHARGSPLALSSHIPGERITEMAALIPE